MPYDSDTGAPRFPHSLEWFYFPLAGIMEVLNPMPSGPPLRFANATQDEARAGWLTLGSVRF